MISTLYLNNYQHIKLSQLMKGNNQLIKDNNVELGSPIKLNPKKRDSSKHEESINPIVEDGKVVGVIYKCKCGRQRRIMFEYNK